MQLEPVSRRSPLTLDDRSAARPSALPADDDALREETRKLLGQLGDLQAMLYADARYALLVVLQARDAGGKDGTVRKVFGACNPLGCEVTSFRVPTPEELSHDYLWRVHRQVPARGMVGIFNRSHYEDVLVVRVKNIVPKPVWSKRYDEINEFERMLDDNRNACATVCRIRRRTGSSAPATSMTATSGMTTRRRIATRCGSAARRGRRGTSFLPTTRKPATI
jgi:polyphosphate kinase 2 (PPK2 family)